MFSKALSIAALATLATATERVEVHDGFTYILSGPKQPDSKDAYQLETCSYCINLLSERLGQPVPEYNNDPDLCMEKLVPIKTELGPDGLMDLLAVDIQEGEDYWLDVIAKSNPDNWVDASGRGVAFLPNLTAAAFTAWSSSPLADAANSAANAEHYKKETVEVSPGVLQSEIIEGWGGVETHFTIPSYSLNPDPAEYPMIRPLPDFPYQAVGDKVLTDENQTRFGVLHISARDVDGADYDLPGQTGVDIYASVWYQDGVEDAHLEDERTHIIVEIVNLSLQAQRDIVSGAFNPGAIQV